MFDIQMKSIKIDEACGLKKFWLFLWNFFVENGPVCNGEKLFFHYILCLQQWKDPGFNSQSQFQPQMPSIFNNELQDSRIHLQIIKIYLIQGVRLSVFLWHKAEILNFCPKFTKYGWFIGKHIPFCESKKTFWFLLL